MTGGQLALGLDRAVEVMAEALVPRKRTEREKRDDVLDALASCREQAVSLAREAAREIVRRHGTVTSPEVLALLRARGHGPLLDSIDRRFMGVVFNKGWERAGWASTGSHARPVAVWKERLR